MTELQTLMNIIGLTVLGKEGIMPEPACDAASLYRLAKKHDLAHLLAPYFTAHRDTLDKALWDEINKVYHIAMLRAAKQDYVQEIVCDTLQRAGIAFVLLKGAHIKALYPEAWMRTSCDIDALVKERDFDAAVDALTKAGFTTDGQKHIHDLSLYLDGVHFELHFNILEEMEQADKPLGRVWQYTECEEGVLYRETDAFFVFHHIAHMAYHFLTGGCGIKPFVDLCLLRRTYDCKTELAALLEEAGLTPFYDAACALCDVWFDGAAHNEVTKAMEAYVIGGGAYGSGKNHQAVRTGIEKSRGKYLAARAFPSVSKMKMLYPVLTRSKAAILLLPFCFAHRAVTKLLGKDSRRTRTVTKNILTQKDETIGSVSKLIEALGLE